MEVHHPKVEKKNFKEYSFEFLMIFLAVTLGFFAEGLRESMSEKHLEKQYLQFFLEDLKKDTAAFDATITTEQTYLQGNDTLLNALSHPPYNDSSPRMLYYLYRKYSMTIRPTQYTYRTITQLKSTGGLRLISDKSSADSIVAYYKAADDVEELTRLTLNDTMIPLVRISNKIFDTRRLLSYTGKTIKGILHEGPPLHLMTTDPATISEYIGYLYDLKQVRQISLAN